MQQSRRDLLQASLLAASAARFSPARAAVSKLGIPGPYPGRVIAVQHPGSIVSGAYQAEPVRNMMHKGMMELTGAPGWPDAWRVFFEPSDVVGIKVCPVGGARMSSDATVLHQIVDGLKQAGVKPGNIVVFNRYRREMFDARINRWLPEGVRIAWSAEAYEEVQQNINGYDPDVYVDMALCLPGQNPSDEHVRRSYASLVLTKQINKFVNLPVVKHHQSAGITITLKNMSHGLVNNVRRSHVTPTANACGTFIPAVVNLPVIRQKAVLHIVDGIKAQYHGGPGGRPKYQWEHKTMYFGTDPVALDKVGWKVLDDKRKEVGMASIALSKPDADSHWFNCQVEHVELAGLLGLGVFDDAKIEVKRFDLA
ncbi:MAG: DUF362 domain-containing protein [Bryobacterales bacterium]|nr:DUF362 domain-containing protein [Bryobacterales bacterium]